MNVKSRLFTAGVAFFLAQGTFAQTDTTQVESIDEVVVVAYGRQKKETVVGSNAQIKAEQIVNRSISNAAQAIEGAAPGVLIASATGQPGSSPSIRIRGIGSFSASNAPLYIVDGVPFFGGIESINPNDIETINVLKDAASTSLYGSSAANGVVLITTKSGRRGRDVVNLNVSTGFSERSVPQYDRLDAAQYYPIVWESLRNGVLGTAQYPTVEAANAYASNNLITVLRQNVFNVADNQLVVDGVLNPNAQLKYTDLDWDEAVARTGFRQNYDLNYSGGSEKTKYFASLAYLNETGYIINSDFERFSGRLNVESQLRDWVKVGINLAGANSFGNSAVDGADNATSLVNPYYFSRRMGPIYSPYLHDANGNNVYNADGTKVYDIESPRGGDAYTGRHTILENLLNKDFNKYYNVSSRFMTEFRLLKDLYLTSNVGYDTRNRTRRRYVNKILGDAAPAGAASRTLSTRQTITWNQLLNYRKDFGVHGLELLAGHESNKMIFEETYAYKQGQVADNNDDLINFVTPTELTSETDHYNKEGYFGRVNYDYMEKYLLSASIRWDASSRFKDDVRWSNFWSVGAGWNIHKEPFLRDVSFVNELKLRGSYGEVGNDGILDDSGDANYYAYQSLFDLGYNNAAEPGIYLGSVADPFISWETNKQKDIALDFAFLQNRISGTVELYKRDTEGLLFNVNQPLSGGVPGGIVSQNVGNMFNQGVELALNVVPVKTQDFRWDVFANASKYKNEVTKLPEGQTEIINGSKKIMVGHSLYDFWLRQWYGVDPANGNGLFLLDDQYAGNLNAASDYVLNGVNVTTNGNRAKYDYSGTSIPDWFGSFGTNFTYKNFFLNSLFTFAVGGKVYDTNYAQLMSGYPQGVALSTDILNRWQNPGDITDVPKLTTANAYTQYALGSTRWLVDSDYINFRSLTVGYNFSSDLVRQFQISNAKIFVNGENLWAKTARKGMEPNESFNGTTVNRYSPARVLSLGLNVSF